MSRKCTFCCTCFSIKMHQCFTGNTPRSLLLKKKTHSLSAYMLLSLLHCSHSQKLLKTNDWKMSISEKLSLSGYENIILPRNRTDYYTLSFFIQRGVVNKHRKNMLIFLAYK